jgi:uncharacterized protein YceK
MLKTFRTCIVIFLFCSGCDTAAKQQQAEQARTAATEANLKQIGEDMQNKSSVELPVDGGSKDSP